MIFKNKKELIGSISPTDVVLDIGFVGHGVQAHASNWVHGLLKERAAAVYGLDLEFDESVYTEPHYKKGNAEQFQFAVLFDVIFASDIIEHLSNPGLFLESCKKNLKPKGKLILTTGNAFCLFNLAEKLTKYEPTTNADHTCYFNTRTLRQLLQKNAMEVERFDYVYELNIGYTESFKKKFLNVFYWIFSLFTDKFIETLVVTAVPEKVSAARR